MTTESEIRTAIGKVCFTFQKLYDRANSSASVTDPLDELLDDVTVLVQEPWGRPALQALGRVRSGYSSILAPSTVRASIAPLLSEYARIKGFPESSRSSDEILTRIFDDFVANTETVKRRNPTFGTVSAGGSNVGTGTVIRCTTDADGEVIEAITPEAKSFRCIGDYQSGTQQHQERFEVRGAAANFDWLEVTGSGRVGSISALSALDTQTYVQNPSWSDGTGTTTVTALPGWTPSTAGVFTNIQRSTSTYRGGDNAATQYSLRLDATESVEQALSTRRATFSPGVPYVCQVAWNREVGSGSGGNIVLTLGGNTATVAIGSTTGWNLLRIALTEESWLKSWNGTDPIVKAEWTSASSGYVLLDDLILAPMTRFDGSYWAAIGGPTAFLREDTFTFTDSVSTESIVQYWLWYAFGRYLPSAASPTWADPS